MFFDMEKISEKNGNTSNNKLSFGGGEWMITQIAWRNIWRNKKRSLIIIAAVIIGLWSGIFLMAFYNGMIEQRINSAISGELSHIQLHHPDFRKDYEPKFFLNNGGAILQQIQANPNVKAAAGRIILKGMIASAAGSSGISINGVMPTEEKQLTNLPGKIVEGNYFDAQKHNEIIISQKVAQKLKVKLRNKVVLTFQDTEGNIASGAYKITAIYKTVNSPYDESNVFVNINDVALLAGLNGQLNEVAVLLTDNTLLNSTQTAFKQNFAGTDVQNWTELSPELGLTVSVSDQMVFIFMGIILLALSFGIINTMLMAVLERTREIGMLLALGMNRLKVFAMIVLETFFLVLAGCPVGYAIGLS
jgi:putative ABC transport system permease protein